MDDAALRILEALRETDDRGLPAPRALQAFVCLMLGVPLTGGAGAVAVLNTSGWTDRRAAFAAFRVAYESVTRVPRARPTLEPSGTLAVERIVWLPPAERAALALACVVGLDDSEAGSVLGLRPAEVRARVNSAVVMLRALPARGARAHVA